MKKIYILFFCFTLHITAMDTEKRSIYSSLSYNPFDKSAIITPRENHYFQKLIDNCAKGRVKGWNEIKELEIDLQMSNLEDITISPSFFPSSVQRLNIKLKKKNNVQGFMNSLFKAMELLDKLEDVRLNASCNDLEGVSIESLAKNLKNLDLNVSLAENTQGFMNSLFKAMKPLDKLKDVTLSVESNNLQGVSIESLSRNLRNFYVDAFEAKNTQGFMNSLFKAMEPLDELEDFTLSAFENDLEDVSIKNLAKNLRKLHVYLSLAKNTQGFMKSLFEAMKPLDKLKDVKLDASHNDLEDVSIESLAKSLSKLDMDVCGAKNTQALLNSLFKAMEPLGELEDVTLSAFRNDLEGVSIESLSKYLRKLHVYVPLAKNTQALQDSLFYSLLKLKDSKNFKLKWTTLNLQKENSSFRKRLVFIAKVMHEGLMKEPKFRDGVYYDIIEMLQ